VDPSNPEDAGPHLVRVGPEIFQDSDSDTAALVQKREQEMLRPDVVVAECHRLTKR
jgi:hypothetical protein